MLPRNAVPRIRALLMAAAINDHPLQNPTRVRKAVNCVRFLKAHYAGYPGASLAIERLYHRCQRHAEALAQRIRLYSMAEQDDDIYGWVGMKLESAYPGLGCVENVQMLAELLTFRADAVRYESELKELMDMGIITPMEPDDPEFE